MKNIIIGTAGHIDHGKTTLIKALTGRDTDRLKEEKKRGISIDLGFTYFDLPSGRRAGIIDVPGHEKFIKNMLAGVMGIDIVTLVIAADEGIMPQTKEHLAILGLLGIKKGIVVITKTDLVDDEWLEFVKEDIEEYLKGTFLETSPMISVSSTEKLGIVEVAKIIDKLTEELEEQEDTKTPRLSVDRVFTITGFGTVVTGTLLSGVFKIGDEVQVFPGNKVSRIRTIQVHGDDTDIAYSGQRVAINLVGLKKEDIKRGDVIAPKESMQSTMMLDIKLNLLEDSQRIIENRTRLRLYIGTNEVLCRVVLLDKEQLTPGESCFAQLRLENEVVAKRGDRFIIRFYSPMITIGGGEIIEANPPKRKRFDSKVIEELQIKEAGEPINIIEKIIKDKSKNMISIKELSVIMVIPTKDIKEIVKKLKNLDKIIVFSLSDDDYLIHKEYYKEVTAKIIEEITWFHKKNTLKLGMFKEEIRSKYLSSVKPRLGDCFIDKMIEDDILKQNNEYISMSNFEIKYNSKQELIKREIEKKYLDSGFVLIKLDVLLDKIDYNREDVIEVVEALFESEILIKLKEDVILHHEIYDQSIRKTRKYIEDNGSIDVSNLRDKLNTNRKCAIALLEDFDSKKITKRVENKRILY